MFKTLILGVLTVISFNAYAIPWEVSHKIDRGQSSSDVLIVAGNPNAQTYAGLCDRSREVGLQWIYLGNSGEKDVVVTFCGGRVQSVEQKGFTK